MPQTIHEVESSRRRHWDARGGQFFRLVELLDIVRVELELRFRNPEAAPPTGGGPGKKAGDGLNSHGYQQDKNHSVWHSSELSWFPSCSTRTASSLPPDSYGPGHHALERDSAIKFNLIFRRRPHRRHAIEQTLNHQ
eukprot:SAG31_NODE_16774_length_696_cov_8.577889_1_plen_136_part_10